MKRTFILLMSAAALIVVLAISGALGWQASTSTYWDGGGWQSTYSASVEATSSPAYLICEAPYSADGCAERYAKAVRASDYYPEASAYCNSPGAPSKYCCNKVQWTPSVGTLYKALAYQRRFTNQSCGPTKATIQSSSLYSCSPDSPGGE